MSIQAAAAVGAVALVVSLAGCTFGGTAVKPSPLPPVAHSPSPKPSPSAGSPCAAPGGSPAGNISAAFPVALAFAPDGRLFWADRGGAIKVWQGGAAQDFAAVSTVTTQPGGGYSERGLLGLAISPSFAQDRFVYAIY